MGDHSEVVEASKSCVSIPQDLEVSFVKNVDELGFEGEVGVLYLAEDAKLFFVLTNLFANYHCSSGDVLREGVWIVGPDEIISRDLMVRGRGEAETKDPV